MKRIIKILFWVVGVIIAIFILLSIAVALFAKPIVISQIEQNLKLKTSLDSLSLGFPLSVNIRNLNIRSLAKVEEVSLKPSLLAFLAGKIVLNELRVIKPEITLVMDKSGKFNFSLPENKGKRPPVFLAGLDIRLGKVFFIDRKIDPAGYKITLSGINVKVSKVAFPITSLSANFNVSAMLGENAEKGSVTASGWIDFGPKNMEGRVELKDIEMTYFTPYFQGLQDSPLAGFTVSSAKLNASSDLKAVNNNLTAKCRIKVMNLSSEFTFKTKLDKPSIDPNMIKQQVVGAIASNIFEQLPQKIAENPEDFKKQMKDLGKSLKEMFLKKE
ncbi:MAG: DUF748 domain-containing protein [Candidatus Omnitrophota bacterium]|nr:DUF748 domain-containing protein [Candidatus Omnitrophota bacterium]MBU1928920.1 DUF748 domain-containing protein [Candidatus Omnitrophota bacterium]MBU2035355.1 DUF748 domain-containing protein [Candidatus Omnitrophota bacterium]MBU2221405.1 DUF748 domain-containing protein [Candidatus Omnitrophota bacterium]